MNFGLRVGGQRLTSYLKSFLTYIFATLNSGETLVTFDGDFIIFEGDE